MEKRSQKERLTVAFELLSSVWEEYRNDTIQNGNGQIAVNIQTQINRIVWKLNTLLNQEGETGCGN